MLEEVELYEQTEKYIAYDCGPFLYIKSEKGGVFSDHEHTHEEIIFLMEGEVQLVLGNKTETIRAPQKIVIPANTYHKFTALTDCIGIEIK